METKKRTGSKVLKVFSAIGLVIGFIGVIVLVADFKDGIASFKPAVDLYGRFTDFKNLGSFDAIDSEVYASAGCFGTIETTRKQNGSITGRSYTYYYAIPVFSADETYWIGLEISSDHRKTLENISDETLSYLAGLSNSYGSTTFSFQGGLKKMDSEMYGYMKEYFEEMQFFATNAELEQYLLPTYIDIYDIESVRGLFIFGVVGTLIGLLSVIYRIVSAKRSKQWTADHPESNMRTVGGVTYPKSAFATVDRLVTQHENVFAVQELCNMTGISAEEAGQIIKNWSNFYG